MIQNKQRYPIQQLQTHIDSLTHNNLTHLIEGYEGKKYTLSNKIITKYSIEESFNLHFFNLTNDLFISEKPFTEVELNNLEIKKYFWLRKKNSEFCDLTMINLLNFDRKVVAKTIQIEIDPNFFISIFNKFSPFVSETAKITFDVLLSCKTVTVAFTVPKVFGWRNNKPLFKDLI